MVGIRLAAEAALPVGAAAPRPPTREEERPAGCGEATHASVAESGGPAAGLDGDFIEYSRESWEFLSWSDGVSVVA